MEQSAHAQREDERHGDRPGGDAAGIEGHWQEVVVSENGEQKDDGIEREQHLIETLPQDDAQKPKHQKQAYARGHGEDQGAVWKSGHLRRQHGQIRLGDGDDRAHQKTGDDEEGKTAPFREARADHFAHGRHGDLRAQGKQRHAKDEHRRAESE